MSLSKRAKMGWKSAAAIAAIALVASVESSKADIIITQVKGPTAVTGGYAYTYDALLSFNSELATAQTGYPQFTTLYDAGVTSLYNASTGDLATDFTFSFPLTSTAAYRSLPVDSPTVTNIRITYNGAADSTLVGAPYMVGSLQVGTQPVDLGQFTIFSTSNVETYSSFDGQSETAFGSAAGAEQGNNSTTTVPTNVVPEPASLGLIALAGAGLMGRRRRA